MGLFRRYKTPPQPKTQEEINEMIWIQIFNEIPHQLNTLDVQLKITIGSIGIILALMAIQIAMLALHITI